MICLDTNVVIHLLRRDSGPVRERLRTARREDIVVVSSVVVFELRYGIAKSTRPQESAAQLDRFLNLPVAVLPFEHDDAKAAGTLRGALEKAGTPIGAYDLLIAAQASCRGAILVTANTREFARVPNLALDDWTHPPSGQEP